MSDYQSLIEDAITQSLAELDTECELYGVRLLLIGGFAVRAYGQRRRATTDVDFIIKRVDRNQLIGLLQRQGFRVDADSRFGMKASREVGDHLMKVDISIEQIHDEMTDSLFRFSDESFRRAERHVVESLSGRFRVEFYVIPLADLMISKLMTARDQDASDAINLILEYMPSAQLEAEIKRKAREAGLANRINQRATELVQWSDGRINGLMAGYVGAKLTLSDLRKLRALFRDLRI